MLFKKLRLIFKKMCNNFKCCSKQTDDHHVDIIIENPQIIYIA